MEGFCESKLKELKEKGCWNFKMEQPLVQRLN